MYLDTSPSRVSADPHELIRHLLEAHSRTRAHAALAVRIGRVSGTIDDGVRATAGEVRRYLGETLPRHEADEDEVIEPRLVDRSTPLDRALGTLRAEHAEIVAAVQHLVALVTAVERDAHRPAELLSVAHDVELQVRVHLDLEESVVFPALRELGPVEQQAIVEAIRARRARAASTP